MNKIVASIVAMSLALSACTRIETGETGVRVGMDKQVEMEELEPGSFNQVMIGDVLTFPVKELQVSISDLTPLASDNSTIQDFDLAVIYNINPKSAAEIYANKNRSFHVYDEDSGDTYLMYNYIYNLGKAATYKVARKYESLKLNDNRALIEEQIKQEITRALELNEMQGALTVDQVIVRQIMPDDAIKESANQLVKAQNEEKKKAVEVRTAKLEAERISVLNANSGAVEYMNAMANMNISEGVREGKVQTIIVPKDFTAFLGK